MGSVDGSTQNLVVEGGNDSKVEDVNLKDSEKSRYKIRLELAGFLVYFGVNASSAVFQDQVLYQTCTSVYNFNDSICDALGTSNATNDPQIKAVENIVQPYAAKIFMAESLVKGIVPAFLVLVIGAWSDKFGRKPVLLAATFGYLGFFFIKTIIAAIATAESLNPWIYIAASPPLALCGGDCAFLSAVYCYVADLTTLREKPLRISIMAGIMALGNFLGQLASSYIYAATNAWTVFLISTLAELIAFMFILIIIKESVSEDRLSSESQLQGLFDIGLLKEMARTVFKKREQFQTAIIWFLLVPIAVVAFNDSGGLDVQFLLMRNKFGWTVKEYTTYNAIRTVVTFVGAAVGIIILQYLLRVRLTIMCLISYGSYVIYTSFYAAAQAPWYLYVGVSVTCLCGVAVPMAQSILTNVVASADIGQFFSFFLESRQSLLFWGKVFTLVSALQAIAQLVAAPIYTLIYNATLETYPGAYYLVGVGLFLISFFMMGFIHVVDLYYHNVNIVKKEQ